MKKILFFFAALLCSLNVAMAQLDLTASLQHGNSVSHFYGSDAFTNAYNASVNGDVITLSPGTFSAPYSFKKGITVRGTGIEAVNKTYISNGVSFYSSDASLVTNIEGVIFSSNISVYNQNESSHGRINFIKSMFNGGLSACQNNNPSSTGPIVRVYNCILHGFYFNSGSNPDFMVFNSYVYNLSSSLGNITTSTLVNCIINIGGSYSYSYMNFTNCIFNWVWGSYGGSSTYSCLPNTAACNNCISINKSTMFMNLVVGANNKTVGSADEVFKTYRKNYTLGDTFELTEEAKQTYLGTDGTQVGMYGGAYPYNCAVQYPIITKFAADSVTTKDGKLTIEVEVDGK